MKKWHVYIIKCKNGSYYTGSTTDVQRRIKQHEAGKGSKYVKRHGGVPVTLMASWEFENRSLACKEEYRIKQLTRKQKEELIEQNKSKYEGALEQAVDYAGCQKTRLEAVEFIENYEKHEKL